MAHNHSALSHFLKRLTLRSRLSAKEQEAVLELSSNARQFSARHDLIRPGQKVEHTTLVEHGLVGRFDAMRDGGRQLTALYVRGDMCDIHSVVSPVAGWGLMAMTASTVLQVPHEELRALAVKYPAIGFALWRDTTADASILAKWVGNLGRKDARRRLAHLVCEMGIRTEVADLGRRDDFTLDMSQELIADAVGMTSVHVNRTLQDLRRTGVLSTSGRQIRVADWQRLVAVAEFDPIYLLLPEAMVAA